MKTIKRALSIAIAVALMLTSIPFTVNQMLPKASASSEISVSSLVRPASSMTVTEVTRIAYAENTMQPPSGSNSVIVKATPSGIPYLSGTYASQAYAGETPVATTITFTPGVVLDDTPTISCSNTTVKMSDSAYSNGTYSWTVLSGTALQGTTLIFTVSYSQSEYNSATGKNYTQNYQTQAVSYVEAIATPAGIYSTYRTYQNWGLGSTNKNRSYLATLVLGKNTYGSVYDGGSGDGSLDFSSSSWTSSNWTSTYGVMKNFGDSGSNRNYNVSYAADGNRPISYIYMDKSIQTTLSDLNLRFSVLVPSVDEELKTTDTLNNVFVTSGVNSTFDGSSDDGDPSNDSTTAALLGIGTPTVASIENVGDSSLIYFTGTGPASGLDTQYYTIALRYQTAGGWSAVYVGHSHSIAISTYDKGELRTLVENIQNNDPESCTVTLGVNEYKGYNPQSWYYASGWEDFQTAYNSAKAVLANPRVTQTEIDSAKDILYSKYKLLVLAGADYSMASVYYSQAQQLDETLYTLASWAKLETALNSYKENYSILYQPAVDKMATDIKTAMDNLEYAVADYTELNKRLDTVNTYINNASALYGLTPENTYNNWSKLVATLANANCAYNTVEGYVVSTYLSAMQQSTVDGYVSLIDASISELSLKGASYTEAVKAEAAYSVVTLSYLVDDVATQLTSAYNSLVALHNMDLSHQSEINTATDNLNYWLSNLEYKPADTEKALALIQTANDIDRTLYEDMSSVDTAVANLESKLDLDIRYQSEIDSAVNALQSAIDKLIANSADYTDVDAAIDRANEIDRQITEQYASTYGFTASEFYSNWSAVESAINSVVRKLDSTKQSTVDGYATIINSAITSLEEATADYTKVTEIQATASNILSNQSASYTDDSINNLMNAYLAVKTGYKISRQAEVDAFVTDIQSAIDALVYVDADYVNVNAKIASANELLDTAEAYETAHPGYVYYTAETKAALEIAIAEVVTGLNITQQSIVNGYALDIQNAINALVNAPADYQNVEVALAKVPGDLSNYTTLTVATLNARIKAVKYTYTTDQQASVDKFATNIETAIAGLKYKTADYTKVTNAKGTVPSDSSLYTTESWQLVQDALDNVVYNREIIYQDEVDLYATAITEAVNALRYKKADYTQVETSLTKIPSNLSIYTDDTVAALQNVLSAINYNLDITHQTEVDAYVTDIDTAVENLTLMGADYTEFNIAEANAKDVIANGDYTAESVKAVQDILDNAVRNLDITQQETVDGYVEAINDAVAKLVKSHADYTQIEELKTQWANYENKELYSDTSVKAVDDAFASVDYTLTGDKQSTVDGYATLINEKISALTYKSANYSKVEAALATIPADLTIYTERTVANVITAKNNIEYNLDIRYQSTVDNYVTAIESAVAGLKYKPADYSAVYKAMALIPSDLSVYTSETVAPITTLLNEYPKVTDIREQSIVDEYAQSLTQAVNDLKLKDADYTKANEAVTNANAKIETGWYTEQSVLALNSEIEKLTYGLDATHQNEIDIITENIVKATNDLVLNLANYTELQKILDLLDNLDSEIYNYRYSNYNEVMCLIADYRENTVSKNMNLTIDKQGQVDEMTETLQGYIDSLIKLENGEVFDKKDGSTTVIDNGYIYGLKSGLTKKNFEENYITADNVTITYENVKGMFLGTGSKIIVKSSVTDITIKELTVVIYGDVDGNAKVDIHDYQALNEAVNGSTISSAGLKAIDFDNNSAATSADLINLGNVISGMCVINQSTGIIN